MSGDMESRVWFDPDDNLPDWKDCGRRIRFDLHTGEEVEGILHADEYWTGEDEVPVFFLMLPDHVEVGIFNARRYMFIS